jgi:hypothetical protein
LSPIKFPIMQSQVPGIFGHPSSPEFAAQWIVRIDLSEFEKDYLQVKEWNHSSWFGFEGNRVIVEPFKAALRALTAKGLNKALHTFGGCWVIRPMKGNAAMTSMHAWGLPVDLNAQENPFGQAPKFKDDFVLCFSQNGWEWGGLWKPDHLRDGMHFQICWIRLRTGPLAPLAWSGK